MPRSHVRWCVFAVPQAFWPQCGQLEEGKLSDMAIPTIRVLTPDDERHGKPSTYTNHRCRCDLCRVAWRAYMRDLRQRRADAAAELRAAS